MAEKRRGLGRGLGALIPNLPTGDDRPVDVFFPGAQREPGAHGAVGPAAVPLEEDGTSGSGVRPEVEAVVPADDASDRSGSEMPSQHPGAPFDVTGPPSEPGVQTVGEGSGTATEPPDDGPPPDAVEPAVERELPVSRETGAQHDLVPVPGARFAEVPVGAIRANPRQPRSVFDEEELDELVGSIREIGVLQPVVVRPVEGDDVQFELIMGERRWRATQAAGLDAIPAIIRETDDSDLLRDALLENLHRSQLNPLEEAAAYRQLLDDFECTHDELAQRIHRSRPQISNTLRLLRLPPLVQRRVAAGVLSAGHARALLGLADGAAMERLAQRIVAEGLSVRATEEIVTLGGDEEKPGPRPRPRAGDRNAALDELAGRLSDKFETRVKIALGKSKGRLTVEFASVQDLNRILATFSPDDPGLLK
ncbi:ParB/RepB/Spo0J family partition protein [Cellulomonas bogoriensis]|uniref:Chromosome partitioning protein ParB n=1 Tax=Cellulomonas bogoriensis 69B4 = DSM 16987 TaxID=1386082 RepID=A0A0A0C1P6_9CELL|nr:ParB/RepB/Spo0J family partition protein [Cellulomonas bogoriensis]KGM13279.1 chromosome partitioning protein ParB [Cellulomonas bogoriensis 69B4 = DSM 16987]